MRTRQLWVIGLVMLVVAMQAFSSPPPQDVFRLNGSQLEFFDGSHWYPAMICPSTGDVLFQSGGSWWSTGYTAADLAWLFSGSSIVSSGAIQLYNDSRQQAGRTMYQVGDQALTIDGWYSAEYEAGKLDKWYGEDGSCAFGWLLSCPDIESGEVPEWRMALAYSPSYTYTDYNVFGGVAGLDIQSEAIGNALTLYAMGDRLAVATSLIHQHVEYDGDDAGVDNERLGLLVTPVYRLLDQEADGMNLSLLMSMGITHAWYDTAMTIDDPSYVFAGAGAMIGKALPKAALNLVYLFGSNINIDGDEEMTGKSNINMHQLGGYCEVPLTKTWTMDLGLDWLHTSDLPDMFDEDEYYGSMSLTRTLENWVFRLNGRHSIENDNLDEWMVGAQIMYKW